MSRSRLATAVRFGVVFVLLLVPRTVFTQQQPMWVPTDLGTLGGSYSSAADINATGQAVGESDTATGFRHAFIWTRAGGMIDLGTLGESSDATAINEAGQVTGQSWGAGGVHAFLERG